MPWSKLLSGVLDAMVWVDRDAVSLSVVMSVSVHCSRGCQRNAVCVISCLCVAQWSISLRWWYATHWRYLYAHDSEIQGYAGRALSLCLVKIAICRVDCSVVSQSQAVSMTTVAIDLRALCRLRGTCLCLLSSLVVKKGYWLWALLWTLSRQASGAAVVWRKYGSKKLEPDWDAACAGWLWARRGGAIMWVLCFWLFSRDACALWVNPRGKDNVADKLWLLHSVDFAVVRWFRCATRSAVRCVSAVDAHRSSDLLLCWVWLRIKNKTIVITIQLHWFENWVKVTDNGQE